LRVCALVLCLKGRTGRGEVVRFKYLPATMMRRESPESQFLSSRWSSATFEASSSQDIISGSATSICSTPHQPLIQQTHPLTKIPLTFPRSSTCASDHVFHLLKAAMTPGMRITMGITHGTGPRNPNVACPSCMIFSAKCCLPLCNISKGRPNARSPMTSKPKKAIHFVAFTGLPANEASWSNKA
jgi:hypothetical protein